MANPLSGWMRWHRQNLNTVGERTPDGYRERPVGSMLRHGRCWIYPGASAARRRARHLRRFQRAMDRGEVAYRHGKVLVPIPADDDGVADLQRETAYQLSMSQELPVVLMDWSATGSTEDRHQRRCIMLSWSFLQRHFITGVGVELGAGDEDLELHAGLGPLFSLFIGFEGFTRRSLDNRAWSLSWHDQALWLEWGDDPWEGPLRVWHAVDWLLGAQKYHSEHLSTRDVRTDFTEGTYTVRIELTRDTWRRARWPIPTVRRRARVEVLSTSGIPVPVNPDSDFAHLHKNGADALYSLTCIARDEAEAVRRLHESVERDRERHGWWGMKDGVLA